VFRGYNNPNVRIIIMPKTINHEIHKEEILTRCLPLFADKGYASVSIREIGKELGISTGALYHYFATKEELFTSMVQNAVLRNSQEIHQLKNTSNEPEALAEYIAQNENHYFQMLLLAVDVKRHHLDSSELSALLVESWESYKRALNRFFMLEEDSEFGNTFLSYLVGALFLKDPKTSSSIHYWKERINSFSKISEESNILKSSTLESVR